MRTLRLTIELENDEMQDGYDAYQAIAKVLPTEKLHSGDDGIIKDANGNTVGHWEVDR